MQTLSSRCAAANIAASHTAPSLHSPSLRTAKTRMAAAEDARRQRHADTHRQAVAERAGRRFDTGQMVRRRRMLAKETAVLAVIVEHRLRIESAFGEDLEQGRCAVTLAENEAVAFGIVRVLWIDPQHLEIERR